MTPQVTLVSAVLLLLPCLEGAALVYNKRGASGYLVAAGARSSPPQWK